MRAAPTQWAGGLGRPADDPGLCVCLWVSDGVGCFCVYYFVFLFLHTLVGGCVRGVDVQHVCGCKGRGQLVSCSQHL